MKKPLINIKIVKNSNIISTSSVGCSFVPSDGDLLVQSNGTYNTGSGLLKVIWKKDNNLYKYNSNSWTSDSTPAALPYYNGTPDLTDGKWYHVHFTGVIDEMVECTNPESHISK